MTTRLLAILIAVVTLAAVCVAYAAPTASTDIVPTGDWSYNALAKLAAEGYISGVTAKRFLGDWRYSREEMAGFVKEVLVSPTSAFNEQDALLLSKLAREYSAELQMMDVDSSAVPESSEKSRVAPELAVELRASRAEGDNDLELVYDAAALSEIGKNVLVGASITNRRMKYEGGEFSRLDTAFVKGDIGSVDWEIGKDYLWWGPAYSSSMILSDNSPAFPMLLMSKDFSFGRRIGKVKVSQFISSFNDDGKRYYVAGRRWEKRFSSRFHFGVSETAKMSKRPNPLILIIPSLYLYEHIYLDDVDQTFNALLGMDMSYRFSSGRQGYVEFLIDDMVAPGFLRDGPAWDLPRKVGFLVGGKWPDVFGDGKTDLRLEAIYTDPGVYGATRDDYPDLEYTRSGSIIGHPVGGNSEAIFARVDHDFGGGWAAIAEYLGRRPHDKTRENPDRTHKLRITAIREISDRFSVSACYESLKTPESEDRIELLATCVF